MLRLRLIMSTQPSNQYDMKHDRTVGEIHKTMSDDLCASTCFWHTVLAPPQSHTARTYEPKQASAGKSSLMVKRIQNQNYAWFLQFNMSASLTMSGDDCDKKAWLAYSEIQEENSATNEAKHIWCDIDSLWRKVTTQFQAASTVVFSSLKVGDRLTMKVQW